MEKNLSSPKILNIVLCLVLLITFVVVVGTKLDVNAEEVGTSTDAVLPSVKQALGNRYEDLIIENEIKPLINTDRSVIVLDLDYYIEENRETIEFFSKAFDYNVDDVIADLKSRELENDIFLSTNIGYLKNSNGQLRNFSSFEYGLSEYFFDLSKTKKIKKHKKYVPYTGDSHYVEKLVIYYSSIYNNTDTATLLSIGAAESGFYKVKFMLRSNNIYGGMSNRGLVRHDNIELGVLSYVRMMSRNYYGKGLNTPILIGKVYCPTVINGVKQASPHWLGLVANAKTKYNNYQNVEINDLIEKTEMI